MLSPSQADIERMLGGGPKGMAIIWSNESRHEVMYCATALTPNLTWKELPLLSKLGVSKIEYAKPNPNDKGGVPDIISTRNISLEAFTMDCDPASPSFGVPGHTTRGQILLRRNDHKSGLNITRSSIEPLELFIEERLAAIKAALPDQEAASLQYAQLNAKSFKQFFKAYRAEQARKYRGMDWEKMVCPVELATLACEGCGVGEAFTAGETASNLQKCARCIKIRYCSKACQVFDWKAHKPFCKK